MAAANWMCIQLFDITIVFSTANIKTYVKLFEAEIGIQFMGGRVVLELVLTGRIVGLVFYLKFLPLKKIFSGFFKETVLSYSVKSLQRPD